MKIAAFHGELSGSLKFSDLISKLAGVSQYKPLLESTRQTLEARIRPLGLELLSADFLGERQEILITEDGASAILVKIGGRHAARGRRSPSFDILAVFPDKPPDIPRIVSEAVDLTLEPGSSMSAQRVERLQKRLGQLSPNGKLLADPNLRASIRRLYDDQLRKDISAIVRAVGDNPVPPELLGQMEPFRKRPDALNEILGDETIASKRFVVSCESCGAQHLAFADRRRAEAVVADAGDRCALCGERDLSIGEVYSLAGHLLRGIQQGLWLESLASDVLSERSEIVWNGQMVEQNEVDILSVYLDKTFLVECKDSTFGQNDLYVTAMKAGVAEAGEVIIITTEEIHPNVRQAVDRLDSENGARRTFTLISCSCHDDIRDSLTSKLDEEERQYVTQWLRPYDRSIEDIIRFRTFFEE